MISGILSVLAWVGIAAFLWSVSDSLARIAVAMQDKTQGSRNEPGAA